MSTSICLFVSSPNIQAKEHERDGDVISIPTVKGLTKPKDTLDITGITR